jgi:hypothetical protein
MEHQLVALMVVNSAVRTVYLWAAQLAGRWAAMMVVQSVIVLVASSAVSSAAQKDCGMAEHSAGEKVVLKVD